MTQPQSSREQENASALKQLNEDYQQGRLSKSAYRRLRHALLQKADKGEEIMPLRPAKAGRARPGVVVWIAVAGIALLLAMLFWLFR